MPEEFNQEIKPFSTIEPNGVKKYYNVFREETEFLVLNPEVQLKRIMEDKLDYETDRFLLVFGAVMLHLLSAVLVGMTVSSWVVFWTIFSGIVPTSYIGTKILKRKMLKKAKIVLENQLDESLKISSDQLYLAAHVLYQQITETNRQLLQFNDVLKKIKDYRPLSEAEANTYRKLDEKRKKLGALMVNLEEKIDQADLRKAMGADEQNQELPALPPLPSIDRPELEQQINQIETRLMTDSVELQKLLRIKNNYGWNR